MTEESEEEEPGAQKVKISAVKRSKHAGNGRSAREADKGPEELRVRPAQRQRISLK